MAPFRLKETCSFRDPNTHTVSSVADDRRLETSAELFTFSLSALHNTSRYFSQTLIYKPALFESYDTCTCYEQKSRTDRYSFTEQPCSNKVYNEIMWQLSPARHQRLGNRAKKKKKI